VNEYISRINIIFKGVQEIRNDKKEETDDTTKKIINVNNNDIPKELISFILPDFYQSKNARILLESLLLHLENEVSLNHQNKYSLRAVQEKFLSLLLKWSQSVLDPAAIMKDSKSPPEIVPSCSIPSDEEDSVSKNFDLVSSWGDDAFSSCDDEDAESQIRFEHEDAAVAIHKKRSSQNQGLLLGKQSKIPIIVLSGMTLKSSKGNRIRDVSNDHVDVERKSKRRRITTVSAMSQ